MDPPSLGGLISSQSERIRYQEGIVFSSGRSYRLGKLCLPDLILLTCFAKFIGD